MAPGLVNRKQRAARKLECDDEKGRFVECVRKVMKQRAVEEKPPE